MGIAGWVLTNTWGGEWKFSDGRPTLAGGWSGKILSGRSLARLKAARVITQLPIVSVGGILSAEDAKERIKYGANLVQIYTGWIYRGPHFPGIIARALQ